METATIRGLFQIASLLMIIGGGALAVVAMIRTFPSYNRTLPFPFKLVLLGCGFIAVGGFLSYMTASDGSWLQS